MRSPLISQLEDQITARKLCFALRWKINVFRSTSIIPWQSSPEIVNENIKRFKKSFCLYKNRNLKWDPLNLFQSFDERYERFNVEDEKMKLNHVRIEHTKKVLQKNFFTICSISNRISKVDVSKQNYKARKYVMNKKELSKLLGYNSKRNELDDDTLEPVEERISELCFSAPNWVCSISDSAIKPGSKFKRSKKIKSKG